MTLEESIIDQFYDKLRRGVTAANPVMKAQAPGVRDIKANTYCYVDPSSDGTKAVVRMVSDSKNPDAVLFGKGSARGPASSGTDLANILNGQNPLNPRSRASKRKTPLPTFGWWERAVRAAVQTIEQTP